jgi:tetratricopeptide (TPR) repeat protein
MAGMIDQGRAFTLQALQAGKEAGDFMEQGGSYLNLGAIHGMTANFDSALYYFRKTESLWIEKGLNTSPQMGEVYINMSYIFTEKEDFPEALTHAVNAIGIIRDSAGDSADALVFAYNNLGAVYHKTGDYPKAIKCYEKAIRLWEPKYGYGHPIVGALFANIGELYWEIGSNSQAAFYLNKAWSIIAAAQGQGSPMLAEVFTNLGSVYIMMKQYDLALPLFREALSKWPLLGSKPGKIGYTLNNLAYAHFSLGNFDSAFHYYSQGISVVASHDLNNQILANLYSNLSVMLINTRRFEEARDTLYRAIEKYEIKNIRKHKNLSRFYYNLGNLAFDQRDFQKTLFYLQKSLICNLPDFNDTLPEQNPQLKNILDKSTLLTTLVSKAETYMSMYYRNNGMEKYLLMGLGSCLF